MKWLKIPTSTVGRAMFFGSTELLTFFIITANFRAIALGNYFWAGLTDYLTVLVNFGVGKLMMDDAKYHTMVDRHRLCNRRDHWNTFINLDDQAPLREMT